MHYCPFKDCWSSSEEEDEMILHVFRTHFSLRAIYCWCGEEAIHNRKSFSDQHVWFIEHIKKNGGLKAHINYCLLTNVPLPPLWPDMWD